MTNAKETTTDQPQNADNVHTVTITEKTWRELLKIAGSQIDPETAEVCWHYGQVVDPYGVHSDVAAECDCVGRLYFARSPGSKVWIAFGDLPDATRIALWNKPEKPPAPIDDLPF